MRPFNKTTATLVRPHLFSTLCTTPIGKMTLCHNLSSLAAVCYKEKLQKMFSENIDVNIEELYQYVWHYQLRNLDSNFVFAGTSAL